MVKTEIQLVAEAFRERARRLQSASKVLRNIGTGLSIAALFAAKIPLGELLPEHLLEWLLIIVSLLCQVVAEHLFNIGRKAHFNSRDGSRWFLLCSSITDDQTKANIPLDDLKQKAIDLKLAPTTVPQSGDYFFSKADKGWNRLLENLYESLYFTKAIMEKQHSSKTQSLFITISAIVISLITLLVIHTPDDPINPYLTSLALISLAVPVLVETIHRSRTRFAIDELGRIQERMKPFVTKKHADLSADLSILIDMTTKYYCVTTEHELLSNRIYHKYNEKLSANYAVHIDQLLRKP